MRWTVHGLEVMGSNSVGSNLWCIVLLCKSYLIFFKWFYHQILLPIYMLISTKKGVGPNLGYLLNSCINRWLCILITRGASYCIRFVHKAVKLKRLHCMLVRLPHTSFIFCQSTVIKVVNGCELIWCYLVMEDQHHITIDFLRNLVRAPCYESDLVHATVPRLTYTPICLSALYL